MYRNWSSVGKDQKFKETMVKKWKGIKRRVDKRGKETYDMRRGKGLEQKKRKNN